MLWGVGFRAGLESHSQDTCARGDWALGRRWPGGSRSREGKQVLPYLMRILQERFASQESGFRLRRAVAALYLDIV